MTTDYLELALGAERWIGTLQRQTDHGIAWSHSTERPEVVSHTLYNGSAGVQLFYLELHMATGQQRFLDVALAAADDLVAYADESQWQSCAMYTGWPGLAFALGEAARLTGRREYGAAAARCLDRLRASAHRLGTGIGWIEPMPFSDIHGFKGDREIYDASVGAAGAGFVLLYAERTHLHPTALEWATEVGERLLEVAQRTDAGLNWALMSDMPFPWNPANFAHGGAGVGAFMAMLYEATHHQRFLDAAKDAATHLMHIAHSVSDGHLVHHHDGDGANLYYLSACHGPPGTTRLFHLLHRITGDATYSRWNDGALRGLLSTGAPEKRSDGFWNNVSQCCGDAGVGDYATSHYRLTRDTRFLDLARREAAVLASRGVARDGGLCWPQAEHRERPKFIQTQSGYMQGAAGIGSFFTHLHTTLAGAPVKIAFPNTPF